MSKPRSTTSFPATAQPAGPRGARPPQRPDLPLIIARLVFALLLLVLLVRGPVLAWAEAQPPLVAQQFPARPTKPGGIAELPKRAAMLVGAGGRALLKPPVLWGVEGLAALGLLVLACELALDALVLVVQTGVMRRAGHSYCRIRVPQPISASRGAGTADHGEDLFHAIHRLLPHEGAKRGNAPWLALTLGAHPDEPVEFGAVLGGGTAAQRASWSAALRKTILGFDAGALVDERPDPLLAVAQPGTIVLWREYTLLLPPSYPLRLPGDATADLLGPLIAALRARPGAAYSEYQVIVRPRHDWDLTNGWRVYALRRLLQLRAKQHYSLTPDLQALQDKLDSPAYDVTLRVTVVACERSLEHVARAELAEITAILLGQYQARSGNRLQRFRQAGGGSCRVPQTVRPDRRAQVVNTLLSLLAAGMGATVMASVLRILAPDWPRSWLGHWAVLPERRRGQHLAARLLPGALIVCAGLLGPWLLARRQGRTMRARLARLANRPPRPMPLRAVLLPVRPWRAPSVLSANELAGLWHLPAPTMGTLVRWLPCRFLPAPPHAFIHDSPSPAAATPAPPEPRIVLGHALRSDGSLAPVGPSLRDLRQILHLTAGMGAGKSRLLANICQQLLPYGFILADGKGDDDAGSLVATVRALIPQPAEARLVILDVLDTDWPIGINPLAGIDLTRPGGVDLALGQVLAIFGRLDPEVWARSMGMQQYIRMAALLALTGEPMPTMAQIKQALIDPAYRAQLLTRCTNIEVRTFWEITFPRTGEQQTLSLDALLRRFDNLLAIETTRYLLTQPLSTFEFRRAMDEGLIVLAPMPDMTLGGMAGLVGMLALQAIVRAAFQRSGSDQSRTTYPLIVDEFQVFLNAGASEDVSTAITRLRSLGIGSIYAHQSLAQLGDLRDVMLINAQSRVMLKTLEPDASVYGRQYAASGLTSLDIANQDANEHQYAVLQCDGQTAGPLSMRPLPWPTPRPIAVPPAPVQPWQTVLPVPPEPADALIARMVYASYRPSHFGRLVAGLAALPEAEWSYLTARWRAISAAQRAHILAHPGCIPERLERQTWLSRLWAALPRVLVAAAYQRQRWMVRPDEAPARVAPPRRIGRALAPAPSTGRPAKDPTETWGYAVSPATALIGELPDDVPEL